MSVFIIAEAGVNHNGSLANAKKLVDMAKEAGADCIKFQTFVAKNIVTKTALKAEYQKKQTDAAESQLDMLSRLELPFEAFRELKKYCDQKQIEFISTAFDFASIDFLKSLGMRIWKIPSGDISNLPYLIKIAQLGKPVLLSTGMSTIDEITNAVTVLRENGSGEITILHCTTEYPTPYSDVNLKAMLTIKNKFGSNVGYSDHTKGIEVPVAAVALGSIVIEKHFTLDRSMEGPDHKASLEPQELKAMVVAIRNIEFALGNGIKRPAESEKKNMTIARKSIVAKKNIKAGEIFTEENLTVKRPGDGISPMKWFGVVGQKASRDFAEDELIET
ncbi:MAG: N-acetylneuraminate synthase [Clostridia bacterium]|nr:N-acetylneuraminate synthase [Clostridia bacterium]